jgi:peptidoglycan/xylan/chitin deacetylase (PgdA/CDA1 family)
MTTSQAAYWAPVHDELKRWRDAGERPRLWLRDDDAVAVTPALRQLMAMCSSAGVKPLIATIPATTTPELADYLGSEAADVAIHGWSHTNHAPAGSKAQEFPIHRPRDEILGELEQAAARVQTVFGGRELPMYVPPWNRIAPEVASLLPSLGFRALSGYGRKSLFAGVSPVLELNTHVDIIDWRGTRGGHKADKLTRDLAEALAWSRESGGVPIGILTHHLVHDIQAWRFLDELFVETGPSSGVRWCSAAEFLAGR